ncbi:hypothetical protein TKK_0007136 [Trichogramma kaykai]
MDSMESREDTFRVKQEPGDTWPDASGNYDFDSMDFGEVKNVEKLQLYELSTNNMNQAMINPFMSLSRIGMEFTDFTKNI